MFLVIVVSAAILVFSPPSAAFTPSSPANSESPNWTAAPAVPENTLSAPPPAAPVVDVPQDNANSLNSDSGLIASSKGEGPTTIAIKPLLGAGVPDTTAKPAPAKPAAPKPAASKPAASPKPAAKPAPEVKPAEPSSAEPKKERRDFWVQVGSYSTRERADGAKLTLDDKGLAAIITNQQVNGETRYRVRVGPYNSRNEADYWLAIVKNMDSFKDSLIWESQSFR